MQKYGGVQHLQQCNNMQLKSIQYIPMLGSPFIWALLASYTPIVSDANKKKQTKQQNLQKFNSNEC